MSRKKLAARYGVRIWQGERSRTWYASTHGGIRFTASTLADLALRLQATFPGM
jgi:hypothetical protein